MSHAPVRPDAPPPTLVIGGAGFIGSHVVEALLARGAPVRVFDDLSSGRTANLPLHDPNLELCIGDMLDAEALHAAMDGMAWCVHLAAQPVRTAHDPYQSALCNILGAINVLEAVRRRRAARLVYASSAAIYGEQPPRPLREDTAARPLGPRGMEKLVVEGYADLYARQHGVHALGLRYFSVYGPRQDPRRSRAGAVTTLLERVGQRRPAMLHGDGRQTRDFIHVEDAAAATVAALACRQTGICNVGTGQATELRELARLLGSALDLKPLLHFVPAPPNEVRHACAEVTRMRAALPVRPPRALRAGLATVAADWAAHRRIDRSRLPRALDRPATRPPRLALVTGRTLQ